MQFLQCNFHIVQETIQVYWHEDKMEADARRLEQTL